VDLLNFRSTKKNKKNKTQYKRIKPKKSQVIIFSLDKVFYLFFFLEKNKHSMPFVFVLECVWYCGSCCGCGLKKVVL